MLVEEYASVGLTQIIIISLIPPYILLNKRVGHHPCILPKAEAPNKLNVSLMREPYLELFLSG